MCQPVYCVVKWVFSLSIAWSLKTCILLHRKTLKTQKIFFGFSASFFSIVWSLVATLRRILAIIAFFTPALGLFSILKHWQAEQYPFTIRNKYHPLPIDRVQLFNQTETISWKDVDRSRYEIPVDPSLPPYALYTGFDLAHYFLLFFIIMIFHILSIALVKYFTSEAFREKGNSYRKIIHVIQNISLSFPYEDWDEGMFSIEEYCRRNRNTETEMLWTFAVNSLFSLTMMIPIWYTGKENQ